ncbi:hypothetical protein [Erythrobacter sp. SD-21]|uniref:hypothetical protein n=1 Tax=Erythrobacter sp. SD-21 TaxID=161528 RepID=UPI000153F481|nr:hypothetical protein [Erythrobacter sp. SD-21]EDL49583.1 hypothetical protein ED21_18332 [Erythrobacter sp. SD-21]
MGQYEPNDSRDVTLTDGHEPGGIKRTGPREAETRQHEEQQQNEGAQPGNQQQALDAQTGGPRPEYDQYEVNQAGNINKQAEAQQGYGNARDDDGQMEQDVATGDFGSAPIAQSDSAQPGEISDRPDERAAADANRPLGES